MKWYRAKNMGSRAIYNESPKMEKIKNEVNAALDLINAGPGPRPRSSPADPPTGRPEGSGDSENGKKISAEPKIADTDIITKVKIPTLEGCYMGDFNPGVYIRSLIRNDKIKTYEKYILCVLAALADGNGIVNLSQREISNKTKISRTALGTTLGKLNEIGAITKATDLRCSYRLVKLPDQEDSPNVERSLS